MIPAAEVGYRTRSANRSVFSTYTAHEKVESDVDSRVSLVICPQRHSFSGYGVKNTPDFVMFTMLASIDGLLAMSVPH